MKYKMTLPRLRNSFKALFGYPFYIYKSYQKTNILYDKVEELFELFKNQNITYSGTKELMPQRVSCDTEKTNGIFFQEDTTHSFTFSSFLPTEDELYSLIKNKQPFPVSAKNLSIVDYVNFTFLFENKIYKAVNIKFVNMWFDLENNAIKELIDKGLIPNLTLTNYYTENFPIIYQAEKLLDAKPNVWSFEALKVAATCTLETNEVLNKHGYTLGDTHPYNILFNGTVPQHIDLGSLCKKNFDEEWYDTSYNEFLKMFVIPLKLASIGEQLIAKAILYSPYVAYTRTKPDQNIFNSKLLREQIQEILKIPKSDIKAYINQLSFPTNPNIDENYNNEFYAQIEGDNLPPRLEWYKIVSEEIMQLGNCNSILDMSGNGGSCLIYIKNKSHQFTNGIVVDDDENVINKLFTYFKNSKNIHLFLMNFMLYNEEKSFLKSDITILNNMFLLQGYPFDLYFEKLQQVTNKYIVIEFTKIESNEVIEKVGLPGWYTIEAFRENFKKYFYLYREQALLDNKYLFIGKIKNKD